MKRILLIFSALCLAVVARAQDGTLQSGKDWWKVQESFNMAPGLRVSHSSDGTNWEAVGYALPLGPASYWGERLPNYKAIVQHGYGVWKPSIYFHDATYYVVWGDPDFGIYEVHSSDPAGTWSSPRVLLEGVGYVRPCLRWDENGEATLSYELEPSRCGQSGSGPECKVDLSKAAPALSKGKKKAAVSPWQWLSSPAENWAEGVPEKKIKLSCIQTMDGWKSLYDTENILTRELRAPSDSLVALVDFHPEQTGDQCGIVLWCNNYSTQTIVFDGFSSSLMRKSCKDAAKGVKETDSLMRYVKGKQYLKITIRDGRNAQLYYSDNGRKWNKLGADIYLKGAPVRLGIYAQSEAPSSGYAIITVL